MILRKTFRFESSHILPLHPGKCSRLHGHSWVLHVEVTGYINKETGMVMDYAEISEKVKPIIEELDHRHLGAWSVLKDDVVHHIMGHKLWGVPWLPTNWNPTSENLLLAIGKEFCKRGFVDWSALALEETCTSYAELVDKEFNEILSREMRSEKAK